jgi:hypothetical protein
MRTRCKEKRRENECMGMRKRQESGENELQGRYRNTLTNELRTGQCKIE